MERAGWDALARGEGQHRLRRRTKGTVAQLPGCVPAPRKGVSRPAPVLAAIVGRRTLAATRRPSGRAQVAVLRRSLPACLCVKVKDKTFQRKYSIHPRVPPARFLQGLLRSRHRNSFSSLPQRDPVRIWAPPSARSKHCFLPETFDCMSWPASPGA
eukprot:XP_028334249.1 dual specificity protein phosphatase 22 isoform X5 [Physeter catodon]